MSTRWCLLLLTGGVVIGTAMPLAAQPASPMPNQAVSANPFGVLLGLFNAEYERKVSESATAGGGASFLSHDVDDYVNADLFYRYYPSGRAFDGWAFGVKVGLTNVDSATYFGAGFDANWSRLMGKDGHFYFGAGLGLKRLFGTGGSDLVKFIPTVRVVNIGYAF